MLLESSFFGIIERKSEKRYSGEYLMEIIESRKIINKRAHKTASKKNTARAPVYFGEGVRMVEEAGPPTMTEVLLMIRSAVPRGASFFSSCWNRSRKGTKQSKHRHCHLVTGYTRLLARQNLPGHCRVAIRPV